MAERIFLKQFLSDSFRFLPVCDALKIGDIVKHSSLFLPKTMYKKLLKLVKNSK
jgi:hypothetical protein